MDYKLHIKIEYNLISLKTNPFAAKQPYCNTSL